MRVRPLHASEANQLRTVMQQDVVTNCYALSRLDTASRGLLRSTLSDFLGCFDGSDLVSGLVLGANVVPVATTPESRLAFARDLGRRGRRCSSIVGPSDEVQDLWNQLEPRWGPARTTRMTQPLMVMKTYPLHVPDDRVRYATRSDLDVLMPACVDMFTHEVGVSPLAHGAGPAYRARVADLISHKRSLVRIDEGKVIFKAEVGAVAAGVAQIQGVWVEPSRRGQGIAVPAMAAVVRKVLDDMASTVTLYVNDFNSAGLATYARVGFEPVGVFSTILF